MREMIDPQLATRLSGMFVNQRTLIEHENAEKRIAETGLSSDMETSD